MKPIQRRSIALASLALLAGAAAGRGEPRVPPVEEGRGGRIATLTPAPPLGRPLPLDSSGAIVRYRFSGVADDGGGGGGIATSVHCTNLETVNAAVQLDVFDPFGTVYSGILTIPPQGTRTFSTQFTAIYFDDLVLGDGGTDLIDQGFGQVLSLFDDIVCSAQTLDPTGTPPAFLTGLEMLR